MKKMTILVAALLFVVGLASQPVLAQGPSGSIGCGVSVGIACNAGSDTGVVFQNNDGTIGSFGISAFITGTSGLPSVVSGFDDFTPGSEAMSFSFASVGSSFADGGTFSLTDAADGDFSVSGTAELGGTLNPTNPLTGPISLVLNITSVSLGGGNDDDGLVFSKSGLTGISGSVNLTLDPGDVSSMSGTLGLPNLTGGSGPGPTPEPGTLLLLGSGLMGFAPFVRRRFARA